MTGLYRHYKGPRYRVLFTGKDSTNGPGEGRAMVCYISDAEHGIHFRELSQFVEPVVWPDGISRPRFVKVEP
jgi:hypothetical protein